jgi:EAL domain-containing protein (putative c-di-GMP-specific phosphodiesterase class I)/CheY-like chemotaxis protein
MPDQTLIKILILDDEPFMLKLLVRMLANLGHTEVSSCDNGVVALERIETLNESPNLILLDLNMPEMDGLEFVRHLVERNYGGSLILISGEDERMQQAAEKLARAHQITVLGHLHKPASPKRLAEMISRWMPPQLDGHPEVMKIYSAEEVQSAIANGELVNYYQPKVLVSGRQVVGVETLVRWRHPKDGIVLPENFIGVAEAHGLIGDLTLMVVAEALAQTKVWLEAGLVFKVAINLSMDNLVTLNFLDSIVELVAKAGVPPQAIEWEVTESRLMGDLRVALEILTRLRLKRFQISIDDFGTGNSSMAQLRDLPFDELKIDQSFVHGACKNTNLKAMFDSSLALAKQLGMIVVAEGVEDQADWDFLRETKCDIAQGFFIAPPMSNNFVPEWVKSWESTSV